MIFIAQNLIFTGNACIFRLYMYQIDVICGLFISEIETMHYRHKNVPDSEK